MMFKSTINYEPYFYLACRVSPIRSDSASRKELTHDASP